MDLFCLGQAHKQLEQICLKCNLKKTYMYYERELMTQSHTKQSLKITVLS